MDKIRDRFNGAINALESLGIPRALQLILLLGLAQGLLYTFIIPPWWHNDEPTHFEYAWLVANRPSWPTESDIDESMRHKLAVSLMKNHYYDLYRLQPNLTKSGSIYIGASQIGDPPLYYWLVAIPLRIVKNTDFDIQNRVARMVSVLLFLGTIFVTWKAMEELVGAGHPLQWMTTVFIALLPGLADTMTSISDDVAAVFVFSLFIWFSVFIIKRGANWKNLLGLIGILLACYFTKNTTLPAFPLALVVILFGILNNKSQGLSFITLGTFTIVAIVLSLHWGDASLWYRTVEQDQSTRIKTSKTPFGEYVFQLRSGYLEQFMTTESVRKLRNNTITLGSWIWSSEPTDANMPSIRFFDLDADTMHHIDNFSVQLTTTPKFFSQSVFIPNETQKAWIVLNPGALENADITVYYDGITVIPKNMNAGEPAFLDPSTAFGTWNGLQFENLARNGSAESGWFFIDSNAVDVLAKLSQFLGRVNVFTGSIQDYEGAGRYYLLASQRLFFTFWGNPARAKVPLLGGNMTSYLLATFTGIGIVAAAMIFWRKRHNIPWAQTTFLAGTLVTVWGLSLMRGGIELTNGIPLLPWARYAFPAIISTTLLLCLGWLEVFTFFRKFLRFEEVSIQHIFLSIIGGIDLLAILSILEYFYWKDGRSNAIFLVITQFALFALLTMTSKHIAKTNK